MSRGQWLMAGILLALTWTWPRTQKHKQWTTISLALILLVGLVHQLAFRTLAEDAFITFRYASNLSSGRGPVFNLGEPVEGYSNFLWMAILGGLHWLLNVDIPQTAALLGIAAALVTILLTYRIGLEFNSGESRAGLLAALLVASSGSFAAYGPSGLETPLFALLAVGAVLCAVRELFFWAGVLVGLATMTRPEGILLLVPLAGWALFGRSSSSRRLEQVVQAVLPCVSILLPWTLWRVHYYGYLVPNALQAKMGMDLTHQLQLGFRYVLDFSDANLPIVVLFAVLVVSGLTGLITTDRREFVIVLAIGGGLLLTQQLKRDLPTLLAVVLVIAGAIRYKSPKLKFVGFQGLDIFLGSIVLLFVLFVIMVGGDWMPAWRFVAPIIPLAAVWLIRLWPVDLKSASGQATASGGILSFAFVAWLSIAASYNSPNMIPRIRLWSSEVSDLSEIGRWFRRSLPPDTWVATYANGALSYYSGLPTIDMLGLTDSHIARSGQRLRMGTPGHIAYDYNYVVQRKPSIVVGVSQLRQTSDDPHPEEFQSDYAPVSFRFLNYSSPNGQYANLLLLRAEKDHLIGLLTRMPGVEVAKVSP